MEAEGSGGAAKEAAAGARPLTAEEEAVKRNTDCVYFLASPLTCKKGSECDYRHSEGARVNPRDCWYWLNGNCMNPKCSFRHPPLDGLFGAPSTPGIATVPSFQASVPAQMPSHYAGYNTSKQTVPCYYFQKGYCLKGDRCPFSHGPQAAGNNPAEQVAKVSSFPSEQPQPQKKDLWGTKESTQQNNSIQQIAPIIGADKPKAMVDWPTVNSGKTGSAAMPVELPSTAARSLPKSETVPNNMPPVKKSFTTSSDEDHPGYYQNQLPVESDPMQDWNQNYQDPPADDLPQNSREADELLGESSPGFDVLVDNNEDDAAYLHNEDDFGRDMYPVEDYEYGPADYDILAHHERDRFNGMTEPDQIGQVYDGYERKRRRPSSERNLDRLSHSERRFLQREVDLVEMDRSDLRHRLRKQRRINGPESAAGPDRNGEWHRRDEHYREERHGGHRAHRDRHQGPRGTSISSRLQGRIKLPGRSPDRVDMRAEKERDRRRLRGRLSPGRPMDFQGGRHQEAGRHQERVMRRSSELASSARNVDSHPTRRDDVESLNFTGPKRLRELRGVKANESMESEASLDFEGPKPLSVILQRKREAALGNGAPSSNAKGGEISAEVSHRQSVPPGEAEKKGRHNIISSEEHKGESVDKEEKEDGQIPAEGHGQSSSHVDTLETEDVIEVDPMEDQELENYDQREGDSDYEAVEGRDYKSEDENAYQDDEDEFDDEDDFARKVGVMFS